MSKAVCLKMNVKNCLGNEPAPSICAGLLTLTLWPEITIITTF